MKVYEIQQIFEVFFQTLTEFNKNYKKIFFKIMKVNEIFWKLMKFFES